MLVPFTSLPSPFVEWPLPNIMPTRTPKLQLSERENERIAEIHMELTQCRHKEHAESQVKDRAAFCVPTLEEAEKEYLRRQEAKRKRKEGSARRVKKETRRRSLVMERGKQQSHC